MMRSVLVAALSAGVVLSAQGQSGTAPLVLRIPTSPRAVAMGDAFMGGTNSEAIFYNPARVGAVAGYSLAFTRFGSGASAGVFSTALRLGSWGAGLGVRYLDYGTVNAGVAEPGDLTTGGPLNAASLGASLGINRTFFGISVGAAVRYASERRPERRGEGVGWDIGLSRDIGPLATGFAIQNTFGSNVVDGAAREMPVRVVAGANLRPILIGSLFDLSFAGAVTIDRDGTVRPGGGAELSYVPVEGWQFDFRVGARRTERFGAEQPFPVTGGVGLSIDRFSFDYAFERYSGPGDAHRFGLRIR